MITKTGGGIIPLPVLAREKVGTNCFGRIPLASWLEQGWYSALDSWHTDSIGPALA
jgi:hypothetical protein